MGVRPAGGGRRCQALFLLLALSWASFPGLLKAFKVSSLYSLYVCPEGQNVTLTCRISGPFSDWHDQVYKKWSWSPREDQNCSGRRPIRNLTEHDLHSHRGAGHHRANGSLGPSPHKERAQRHGVEMNSDHHGTFWITLMNLTQQDGGIYCCFVADINHHHVKQRSHGLMELQVQKGQMTQSKCTLHLPPNADGESAHELVRMESNTQGIENPVFDAGPPVPPESRPTPLVNSLVRRQQSESGRHLLSEPNTPLSPLGPGDVFFPSLEPVPDSPNSVTA
ncbi:V-type immunoglobulin domain-containing suppressor of T-cell activation isoform X2 [Ornithorhynchus anatinus]|uniref:V-type immunoglobulin domain-containing suppressor of T-cell activation isoform X2 n=1 Tax=Ornithorhynchus anatinus TaxID=9258 RepID=UPI0019D4E0DC|nr:V-type immunoglobulin domain-containing suppressor of T-cell activation isoform X2 [Ornithorhynchus anatinus]